MKIGIYNEPWGGGLGGSEVSVAVLAEALAKDHEVEILHQRPAMTRESLSRFANADLHNVNFRIPKFRKQGRHFWNRFIMERRAETELSKTLDLFIAFVHGVPPYCAAPHGVLLVLFPFSDLRRESAQNSDNSIARIPTPLLSLWRQWKWQANIRSYHHKISISDFTRRWTKKRWDVESEVIFPPVSIDVQPAEKTNRILSVGRFAVCAHKKNQVEMLQMFERLKASGLKDWNYDCAGGCGTSEEELSFLRRVNELGAKCGANVMANVGYASLKNLYQKAKIFWHATGMDVDEHLHPELTEHFGITTVEAMAAGCVPVVINKGGQPEIVEHGVSGFLWNTLEEWQAYSIRLMQDDALFQRMSRAAKDRARLFSRETYVRRFHSLLAPFLNK